MTAHKIWIFYSRIRCGSGLSSLYNSLWLHFTKDRINWSNSSSSRPTWTRLLFECLPICLNSNINGLRKQAQWQKLQRVFYKLPLLRKMITDIVLIPDKALVVVASPLMIRQNRLQIRPFNMHTPTHRPMILKFPNINLLGVEFDWTLRCLSKRADVSLFCPPSFLQTSVNISDTGEMGASTPAVTVILGHKAFYLVPTGSREMSYGNIGML